MILKTAYLFLLSQTEAARMDDNVNKTSKTQIKHLQTETLMNCNETNLSPWAFCNLMSQLNQIQENV